MMDDANQRANGQFTGVVPLDVVAREGGLSVMQGILEGRLPGAAMAKTLNFWLTKVEEGLIVSPVRRASSISIRSALFTADGRQRSWIRRSPAP
jgi:hypothetical protein